jgi:arylsulfatase A-like enzyme
MTEPRASASPAFTSAVYFVVLYLIYSLALRSWNTITLAGSDGIEFDPLGPPFSLPLILGEELLLGALLALILYIVWRLRVLRALWLAVLGGYLLLLAAEQLAFKVYFTHWDYVLYADSHDAGAAWESIAGTVDVFFAIDVVLALACVVLLAIRARPRFVRRLATTFKRHPIRMSAACTVYLAATLLLVLFEEQHGLDRPFPLAYAESYHDVRDDELALEEAVEDVGPASLPPGASQDSPSSNLKISPKPSVKAEPPKPLAKADQMSRVRAAIAANKKPLNVVWYLMESTSYRESSLDPDNRYDTTPFLKQLAGDSLVFTSYYAGVAASTRSFFSAMNGFYPYVDKTSDLVKYSQLASPSLVDILKQAGYKTGFFASSDTLFDSLDSFIAAEPYDIYLDKNLLPAAERARLAGAAWGVPEEVMIDKALTWIESVKGSGEPFFLNYNAVYPHHPFKVPAGHEQLYEMDWGKDKVRKRYRATLRYADESVRRMHDGLERLGVADDTLFVVVPDHGETFGDLHPKNHIHAEYCYDEDSHIFLILHNPRALGPAHTSDRLGSQADLLPTLLEVLGLERELPIDGQSLITEAFEEREVYCYSRRQLGLRDGRYKYVYEKRKKRSELYDLEVDPGEQINIAAEHPDKVATYRQAVNDWRVSVTRAYRARVAAAGLSDRQIGQLAGQRRQKLFAGIRVLFDGATLCGGGSCAAGGSSRTFTRGQPLTIQAKLKKASSANLKLDVYDPGGKRVHNQLIRLGGKSAASFAPIPTKGLDVDKRYHARVTTVVYHAVHDTRAFYFRLTE